MVFGFPSPTGWNLKDVHLVARKEIGNVVAKRDKRRLRRDTRDEMHRPGPIHSTVNARICRDEGGCPDTTSSATEPGDGLRRATSDGACAAEHAGTDL